MGTQFTDADSRKLAELLEKQRRAKQEAQEIIRAAQYQARSLKEQLAQSQLEDLKEDYPELFNVNGVYQRGYEQFREEQRQHSRDDYSISR
jgi:3-oxoacyl-(acyl-carrier-protein) synthase